MNNELPIIYTIKDTFKMYCPKCGREYLVDVFEQNPVCKHDGAGLDFEPKASVEIKEAINEPIP